MSGIYTPDDADRAWDDTPSYRPNWRDRARWAREKQGWDAPTPDPAPACEQDAATIAYLHERLDRVEGELETAKATALREAAADMGTKMLFVNGPPTRTSRAFYVAWLLARAAALNPPAAPESDATAPEAPGQGEGAHEAGEGL